MYCPYTTMMPGCSTRVVDGRRWSMRWFTHPGRALVMALMITLIPGVAGAQTGSTPAASPQAPEQAIWERVEGVEQAVVRTWSDVPQSGTPAAEGPTLRLLNGLVVQFDSEENAAAGVEEFRDWMMASMQVNLVDVELTLSDADVSDLGDNAAAVTATGTTGDNPLSISVVVVQQEDRVLAVGSSVMADEDLLPLVTGVASAMLEREPSGEAERDDVGQFSGGLWEIFPEPGDEVLDGMTRQADLPIYDSQGTTPEE